MPALECRERCSPFAVACWAGDRLRSVRPPRFWDFRVHGGQRGYSEIVFRTAKAVIGMLHVPALPGAPRGSLPFEEIRQFVLAEAAALAEGGVDGLLGRVNTIAKPQR